MFPFLKSSKLWLQRQTASERKRSERRRSLFTLDKLELRTMLSISGHSLILSGYISIGSTGDNYLNTISQQAPDITNIHDSQSEMVTDPKTNATGSFSVEGSASISSASNDSGSVSLSNSFETSSDDSNQSSSQFAQVFTKYGISGTANERGTIVVTFSRNFSNSENSSADAYFFDGVHNIREPGTYTYPNLIAGVHYGYTVNTIATTAAFNKSSSQALSSASFSWRFVPSVPVRPVFTMVSASLSSDNSSVAANYSISAASLAAPGQIAFYWAKGPNAADKLGGGVRVQTATSTGGHASSIRIATLGQRPENATYIVAIVDDSEPIITNASVSVLAPPLPSDVGLDSAKIVYFTDNTNSSVIFSFHTIRNPGQFTIALYQSADSIYDTSDLLVSSKTITAPANSSSTGSISVNFTPIPSRPNLLLVINPQAFVMQSNGPIHELPVYLLSLSQLRAIMPSLPLADARHYIGPLNESMEEFQINTPKREAAFLAQIKVESASLTQWNEGGQPDIDSEGHPNLRKGRGPIQLTNELTFAQYVFSFTTGQPYLIGKSAIYWYQTAYFKAGAYFGFDFIHHPEILADTTQPVLNFRVAGWFWTIYKDYAHTNVTADSLSVTDPSNPLFLAAIYQVNFAISKAVNGINPKTGLPNGLIDRYNAYILSIQVLFGNN